MIYTWDYTRHVIIQRQIDSLNKAGNTIAILDLIGGRRILANCEGRYKSISPLGIRIWGRSLWAFMQCLDKVSPERIKAVSLYAILWWFLGQLKWLPLVLHEKADYYLAQDLECLFAAILTARLHKRPVYYDAHEMASEQGDPKSGRNKFYRILEKLLLPRIDQMITPNLSRANIYVRENHLKSKPLVVLNCPPYKNYLKANNIHEILNISDKKKIVLYHGMLMPGRALDKLILSAAEYPDNIVLVMMGDQGSYFEHVLKPIWKMEKLENKVIFYPFISHNDIMPFVASADLGVVIYENINRNNYYCAPLKFYEFIMAGVPIVACDFPEIKNIITKYQIGFTFDYQNPSSIAAVVRHYFSQTTLGKGLCFEKLQMAREQLNWEVESQKLIKIFS